MDPCAARIFVSAGELSGDRYAAGAITALRARRPGLQVFGHGGPALEAAGAELLFRCESLAVTGFSEALGKLPLAFSMFGETFRQLRARRPAVALLVDYPGANLRLAWLCRKLGIPTVFYVAPQRWAWLSFRLAPLRQIDRLAVVLPFEQHWFRARGIDATFVGHPLCELAPPATRPSSSRRTLALFPGSRENELRLHLPLLLQTLPALPEMSVVLGVAPGLERACAQLAPQIAQRGAREALACADLALCCSGTITLEAALAGVPLVCFYRMSQVSYRIARRLVRVPYVALPNIIAGRAIVPELIQHDATPARLAQAARIVAGEQGERQKQAFGQLRQSLCADRPGLHASCTGAAAGASARVAAMVEELLGAC